MIAHNDKINMTNITHNNTQRQTYWPRRARGLPHSGQEWPGSAKTYVGSVTTTSQPGMVGYISVNYTLSFLHTQFYTFQPLVSLCSLREWGVGVGVWSGTSRPDKKQMVGFTLAQVWGALAL